VRSGVVTNQWRLPVPVTAGVFKTLPTVREKRYSILIASVYLLGTLILYIQALLTERFNNFIIFRTSWSHLVQHMPLYDLYPNAYYDYYLYHPSFPVLFLPFAILPVPIGLLLWMLFNSGLVLYAVYQLPVTPKQKNIISALVMLEVLNAVQSSQVNPAMVALMLLTVVNFERRNVKLAALFTCLCFFIKGYGAIVGILFLFYDQKQEYLKYCLLYGLIGTLLPLQMIPPGELLQSYHDWFQLISSPEIKEDGSLFATIDAFRHLPYTASTFVDKIVLLVAVLGLITAMVNTARAKDSRSRWWMAAYLLIWAVIFNQATEPPTYVIAVTGAVAVLVMFSHKCVTILLLTFLIFVTSLCPTDLVPKFINLTAVEYHLKALPCLFVLIYIQSSLFFQSGKVKID